MEYPHIMHLTMRKVFSDLAFWLHRLVVCKTASLNCERYILDRLKLTPTDIAAVFGNYIPKESAVKITAVFEKHIDLVTALLAAQINSDHKNVDDYIQKLYAHAHEKADFFMTLNPNYAYDELRPLLDMNIDLIRSLISARLCSEHQKEIIIFDAMHHNILNLADFLAGGFVAD